RLGEPTGRVKVARPRPRLCGALPVRRGPSSSAPAVDLVQELPGCRLFALRLPQATQARRGTQCRIWLRFTSAERNSSIFHLQGAISISRPVCNTTLVRLWTPETRVSAAWLRSDARHRCVTGTRYR